ncbi:hypothetical protein [Nonomuraea typhae]|uniref:hypothetical protein n=1 Tax=Nonomuraea typhae TaxID=2603600 RepID=UPI0012F999DB|nr:hypothetical protein [Nonomuraea typhae]
MSSPTSPDPAQPLRDDLVFAWSSAINISLDEATPAEPQAVRRALQAHADQVHAHIELLLTHVRADPARLAALPAAAQQSITELQVRNAEPGMARCYLIAAELAQQALTRIREAGAEHDPKAQHALAEAIEDSWLPTVEPFRPGPLDRHRLPRRLARRLNPRWWYRRHRLQAAPLDHNPADAPHAIAMISMTWRSYRIAKIGYMICHTCRQGLVCKVSVAGGYRDLGLGRRLVLAAHATGPDYEWTTTPQYDTAERFWQRMARTTGASYCDDLLTPETRCPT